MAITPITANPPAENTDPWFTQRDAFDAQVKATANAAAAQADANAAALDGLGSAADHPATDFATAAQGAKADSAVQPAALTSYVPTTRQVAGHALAGDVPRAGLNTVGVPDAVFIPTGGTVPGGTPTYTIVIEG